MKYRFGFFPADGTSTLWLISGVLICTAAIAYYVLTGLQLVYHYREIEMVD